MRVLAKSASSRPCLRAVALNERNYFKRMKRGHYDHEWSIVFGVTVRKRTSKCHELWDVDLHWDFMVSENMNFNILCG